MNLLTLSLFLWSVDFGYLFTKWVLFIHSNDFTAALNNKKTVVKKAFIIFLYTEKIR